MEGVIVDAVVGSLVENLISLLRKEFAQIKGVKKDVAKLVSTLSTIQVVLEDAEEKQITSKPITDWLRNLKDSTYDAEDVLDAWSLEIQQRELDFANMGCSSKVSHSISSCFCFKSILFRRRIAKEIKDILGKFNAIAEEKSQFHLNTGDVSQSRSHFSKERETSSIINEPHIYGREENKEKIVRILVKDFVNQENVSVCSIVGMGGLGKTTLAQSIYNDGRVQTHFEKVKIWVCVSDPFDLERVLKTIVESFEKKACDLVRLDHLSTRVKEILDGKRYLIVLDDVWTENQDEWNQLSAVLKGGGKGSSILLTTRSPTVASMTGTPYSLEALSDDDCFSLFKNRALGEEEHPNLIAIGKEIAKKCKGVPLVAKSLGSCLRFTTDESQWKRIRDSEIWSLDETAENTKILATLRLSYNHLASSLKQCFAYCSLFPKDFEIQRIKLIYLWIANGFIKSQEKLELEEVGEKILNELLRMSFFQDTKEDWFGNIETCKMHDLMHDLASSVSSHECLIAKADDTKQVPKTVRHLTLDCELLQAPTNLGHFLSPQSLRTLYFFGSTDFRNFRFSSTLRVLSLKETRIGTLPSSVCDLKHLRFLDLSRNLLASLPESFAKLRNLQFLDLSWNKRITTLPLPVCNLEHLRYLNVSYCKINGSLPEFIHGLKSLRSLDLSINDQITEIPDWIGNLEHLRYSKVSHSISSCFCFKSILFRRRIATEIKEILSNFDEIAKQKSNFHLNTGDVSQSRSDFSKERETSSIINEPHIYGREENKKKIVDILVTDFVNQENVSVYSIVGMGGLGKTTLARSIYNDGSVQRHFEEVKIWVCVSDPFDLERVLKMILQSFEKKACDLVGLEDVSGMVKEILNGKRYLIVLDDVWTENQDEWNQLSAVLKGGATGSSILLTTRSPTVAFMTSAKKYQYRLEALSDDDCFSLFKNCALGAEEHPNLIAIGKEIAKKCKGIPLVAKSLGSCLRFKTDESQWKRIRDSEIWSLDEKNTKIVATLRLSYNHLASPLKQCFAYCSLFPKDFEIQRIKLIYSWIANGFIKSEEKLELEEVGNEIFNELLRMSFFHDAKVRDGNIYSCKMHDFMHDLASSVSAHECLIAKADDTKQVPKTVRHLTLDCELLQAPTNLGHFLSPQPSLRTLCFFGSTDFRNFRFFSTLRVLSLKNTRIETLPSSVCDLKHLRFLDLSWNLLASLPESFAKLRNLQFLDLSGNKRITTLPLPVCNLEHLRYLNVSNCKINGSLPESIYGLKSLRSLDLSDNGEITEIPDSIGNLEHLRYLNLNWCKRIKSLPESIGGLRNLQSLILKLCDRLQALPENMKKMSSLRHIDNYWCSGLRKMPVGIGELKCLQTLPEFVVPSIGGDGACISELQGLDQLRGQLEIRGLENVRTGADAQTATLANKKSLHELCLRWSNSSDDSLQVKNSKEVLEGLLPFPPNLQVLVIWGYKWEPYFLEELFPQNLESLRFWYCDKIVSLPEGLLEHLTSLQSLDINSCKGLKRLGIQGGGVNHPNTSSSSHLQSYPLREISLNNCPELVFSEEDFQQLNALEDLSLVDLPGLTVLPQGIQHLPMLRSLYIYKCSNLKMLPEWIKHLTTLQSLQILYCHEELHKRCEKDKGEDWHLISHIPDLSIRV